MSEAAHNLLRDVLADVLADTGVAADELDELLPLLEAVVEIEVAKAMTAMLARLGSSATAAAIVRKVMGEAASLRADARSAGINPGSLSRAEKRLARLLRESATPT